MATVNVFTAERMLDIENSSVVSGLVDVNGNLLLSNHGGDQFNAGHVVGPAGPATPLPDRLLNGQLITDWNQAIQPGAYYGVTALNGPAAADGGSGSWMMGNVFWHNGSTTGNPRIHQELREARGNVDSIIYRRYGTLSATPNWGAWTALVSGSNITVSDCNIAIQQGIYAPAASALNLPTEIATTGAAILEVISRNINSVRQILHRNSIDSGLTDLRVWERATVDGGVTWSPWATINSPTVLPAFQATLSANYSLSGSPATAKILPFNTELIDTQNNFSTSTYLFTAPSSGLYAFLLTALQSTTTGGPAFKIAVNGVPNTSTPFDILGYGIAYNGATAFKVLSLSAGDQVGAYVINNNGTAITIPFNYGVFFAGWMMR